MQPLEEPTPMATTSPIEDSTEQDQNQEDKADLEEEVEPGEEGNSRGEGGDGKGSNEVDEPEDETVQEPVEKQSEEKELEVVEVEEEDFDEDKKTLDERARRRNLGMERGEEMVEVEGKLVETTAKVVEEFQIAERKRKGKQVATPCKKKKPRQASKGVFIRESITDLTKEPYYQDEGYAVVEMETGESDESDGIEGVYEKKEVEIDHKLLEAMVYFYDPKLRRSCAGRVSVTRRAKSGKRLHLPSLRGLESEEKFLNYVKAIGFEWMLEHALVDVPVNLANEFFTSFRFDYTTDFGTDSFHFRVFNHEVVMNLREWSLCLGLLTPEEDEVGEWAGREIGHPDDTEGFNTKEAWKLIAAEGAVPFKTQYS